MLAPSFSRQRLCSPRSPASYHPRQYHAPTFPPPPVAAAPPRRHSLFVSAMDPSLSRTSLPSRREVQVGLRGLAVMTFSSIGCVASTLRPRGHWTHSSCCPSRIIYSDIVRGSCRVAGGRERRGRSWLDRHGPSLIPPVLDSTCVGQRETAEEGSCLTQLPD